MSRVLLSRHPSAGRLAGRRLSVAAAALAVTAALVVPPVPAQARAEQAAVPVAATVSPVPPGPSVPPPADTPAPVLPTPVVPPPVPSPVGPGATAADIRMASALGSRSRNPKLGSRFSGLVVDAISGRTVWGARAGTGLMPASTTKLTTAVVARRTRGPTARLTTRVVQGSGGAVVLVGAGDPTLRSAQLRGMAVATAAWVRAAGRDWVDLRVDDRFFARPSLATGWPSRYYRSDVAPVRALQVDQRHRADTSLDAAAVFANHLARAGVRVRGPIARGIAPAGMPTLSSVLSAPVSDMVARMLSVSDNDYAEALLRLSAAATGRPTTWAGGRATQRAVLTQAGIPLTGVALYDGSGLSRADRIPARTLVAVLRLIWSDPAYATVLRADALPTAGISGSLRPARGRYTSAPTACARGRVRAKTGTLRDVVALAGFATGSDGRVKVFAFTENGARSSAVTIRTIDGLATTVTGCW